MNWMHCLADWLRDRACASGRHGSGWEYTPMGERGFRLIHHRRCRHCGQLQRITQKTESEIREAVNFRSRLEDDFRLEWEDV